jgi:hypothetical protein
MPRLGVSYKDVKDTALAILSEGKNLSIEMIRARLGTGSNATIGAHLRCFREEYSKEVSKSLPTNPLPSELTAVVKGLWSSLETKADEKVSALTSTHLTALAEKDLEIAKYQLCHQDWQALNDKWQQDKAELLNSRQRLDESLNQSQKDNAILETHNQHLQIKMEEMEKRVADLQLHLEQAQKNLDHFRESSRIQFMKADEDYRHNLQCLQQENKALKQDMKQMTDTNLSQLYSLREATLLAKSQATNIEAQLHISQGHEDNIKVLSLEVAALNKQLHEESIHGIYQNDRVKTLQTHNANLQAELEYLMNQNLMKMSELFLNSSVKTSEPV